jgi:hypothetical protein
LRTEAHRQAGGRARDECEGSGAERLVRQGSELDLLAFFDHLEILVDRCGRRVVGGEAGLPAPRKPIDGGVALQPLPVELGARADPELCRASSTLYAVGPGRRRARQRSNLLLILFDLGDLPRQIFLDGRGHPHDPNPTWAGHSVGNWESDVLVVDTKASMTRLGYSGMTRTPSAFV